MKTTLTTPAEMLERDCADISSESVLPASPLTPEDLPTIIHPTAVIGRDVRFGRGVLIGPKAVVDDHARLGDRVKLGAAVYIGKRTEIGSDCVIDAHATIREGCILGDRVRVYSGAVIGSDGFGFANTSEGYKHKIPQVGIVVIGDDSIIGANCTIDRATLGRTVIGKGAIIRDMTQIAHNVRVGDYSQIGSQCGICGSSVIGSSVKIGCNVGMVGHIRVEDGCTIDDFSGISKSVPANTHLAGYPAVPPAQESERRLLEENLPSLYERVKQLETLLNHKHSR